MTNKSEAKRKAKLAEKKALDAQQNVNNNFLSSSKTNMTNFLSK